MATISQSEFLFLSLQKADDIKVKDIDVLYKEIFEILERYGFASS